MAIPKQSRSFHFDLRITLVVWQQSITPRLLRFRYIQASWTWRFSLERPLVDFGGVNEDGRAVLYKEAMTS